jgi:hypothetical protein
LQWADNNSRLRQKLLLPSERAGENQRALSPFTVTLYINDALICRFCESTQVNCHPKSQGKHDLEKELSFFPKNFPSAIVRSGSCRLLTRLEPM